MPTIIGKPIYSTVDLWHILSVRLLSDLMHEMNAHPKIPCV